MGAALSLYLLTWVVVFQSRPLLPHKWMLMLQPVAIAGVVVLLAFGGEQNLLLTLGGHQLCFFVIAMACHGELARTRPAARYLKDSMSRCRSAAWSVAVRRACGAVHFLVDRRISHPGRARRAVPAARERAVAGIVKWYWLALAALAVALACRPP